MYNMILLTTNSDIINTSAQLELGTVVAWIALIVAIISPIFTTIINNLHQKSLHKAQVIATRGLDVIEEYITIVTREILTTGVSDNYKKAYSRVFLYIPKSLYETIEKLDDIIVNHETPFPDNKLGMELIIKITKKINSFNKFF